jgi:4-hydroxy-3-methylbut-2-enyl diphosphate reductase
MKIVVAKTAGFCMGVRRAVEMVLDTSNESSGPISTYGPLIHNPQVLSLLEGKGIPVIHKAPEDGEGTILIRAHGVPPETREDLEKAGFVVKDATCPRVIRVQSIIKKHTQKGFATIIMGDSDHPEVIGLLGYAGENGYIASTMKELVGLPCFEKAIIVAQTTQSTEFFHTIEKFVKEKYPHYKIFNTICDSTDKRQNEIREIAQSVDAVFVVGGKESGNTQRLAEAASIHCAFVYKIEDAGELSGIDMGNFTKVAITAGASTPNWIIKRVCRELEKPSSKGVKLFFMNLQRFLLWTNLYLAFAAGCLSITAARLQGFSHNIYFFMIISSTYVFSMHMLNHLTAIKADHYNDPERADFFSRYKIVLAVFAIISGGMGIIVAATIGELPFYMILAMSITGLSYNFKLFPKFLSAKYRKIKDIPGSKTVLISLAWGVVISILPVLSDTNPIQSGTYVTFLVITLMVFNRTAFFDILDMQGDRIVRKETIPIILGEKRTIRLIQVFLIFLGLMLIISSLTGIIPKLGYVLLLYPIIMFIILEIYKKGYVFPGYRLEMLIESNLILAGFISLSWMYF